MRTGHAFKKLLTFQGFTMDEMVVEHCLDESEVPVLVNNGVSSDFGTGI